MLKKYSLKALQSAMNHALALDPGFSGKMAPLTGKWLEIVIEPLGVNFFMGFDNTAIKLQDTLTFPADTVIHSSPLGLIRLSLLPASKARSLFNDQIRIQGNIELGQEVKQLFDQIDIDWEGHLAQFTGDIIAHQVGSAWRHARAFGKRMAGSLHANIEEYLHEELRVSPATEELNDFYEDVDKLIMDVDRLQAKMNLLVGQDETN